MTKQMAKVTLTIDDKQVTAEQGTPVLEAAKAVGIDIPHYCYHPGLSIAGNCRMCLIEVEKAPKPMLGCATMVAEGMVVKTNTEKVVKMRQSVMEFMLINHPLDCPTCDQAGECRLQDYYMLYDDQPSRFQEQKVSKSKMIDLGSNVMLDQERCIACTRCIRVCQEVAQSDELALAYRGDHVTITTFPGKKLSNPYAGNTIDVCPVGALTNKDFRYKKRVWFLKTTPSVCPGCSRGCNTEIHHADSQVYRLKPRYNPQVNQYWMCDFGRYDYKYINENRILRPLVKADNKFSETSSEEALFYLASLLRQNPLDEIAVVLHAREINESNKALYQFASEHLQTDLIHFSRHEPKEKYSDNILITPDKNPNQAFIDKLKIKPLNQLKKAKGLIVLNSLSDDDLSFVRNNKIPVLAVLASNHSSVVDHASVVLPIPTYAEQAGHFVNVNGIEQKIEKAFEPKGESKLVGDYLTTLSSMIKIEENRLFVANI